MTTPASAHNRSTSTRPLYDNTDVTGGFVFWGQALGNWLAEPQPARSNAQDGPPSPCGSGAAACARSAAEGEGLQSLFGKSPSRRGFEIPLEVRRACPVRESNCRLDAPRLEFCGVGDFTRVVFGQALLQIFCQADIKMFRHLYALQNIDVEKVHGWLAEPQPARSNAQDGPPSPCGSGAAAFALRCAAGEGWWSRQESNLRPSHCERDALPTELRPHPIAVKIIQLPQNCKQ